MGGRLSISPSFARSIAALTQTAVSVCRIGIVTTGENHIAYVVLTLPKGQARNKNGAFP